MDIQSSLAKLLNLQNKIDGQGGIEKNGDLFEEYLLLIDKILNHYGLPSSTENATIFKGSSTEIIEKLHQKAKEFLLSTPEMEIKILEKAIINCTDGKEILPMLGLNSHLYPLFVINEILLKKKDSPSEVLDALKFSNNPKTLNLLGILALSEVFEEEEMTMLEYLNRTGVKYLNEFLSFYRIKEPKEELKISQLSDFWNDLNGNFEFDKLELKFDRLCHHLMNNLCLVVGSQVYRFTELEIYYFDKEIHPDPYTHKDEQQLNPGNFYFNGFGLDITFGNSEKEVFAGILVRGVKNLKSGKFASGPSNVLKEIFNSFGNIVEGKNSICVRELKKGAVAEMKPFKSSRIGLSKKEADNEDFYGKPYRYLVEMSLEHKFKDKQKVVDKMLAEKYIDETKAYEIMGYKFKK